MPLFARRKESPEFYRFFKNVLGFSPRRTELYHIALTHSSSIWAMPFWAPSWRSTSTASTP